MISSNSHRAALRSAAALGAVLIAGTALAATPAQAATPQASMTINTPSGTVDKLDGILADGDNLVQFKTDLACGPAAIPIMFLTETGNEVGKIAADGSSTVDNSYPYYNLSSIFVDPDTGSFLDGGGGIVTSLNRTSDYRTVGTGSAMEAGKSYSLGWVCGTGQYFDHLVADAAGNAIQTWVTIQRDAGTGWTQILPMVDTSVTLTGAQEGVNDAKLTASVTPAAATGTVEFSDGTATATATVASGVATTSIKGLADGSHSFTAKFTPSAGAAFNPSQSTAVAVAISKVKVATTVELTGKALGYDAAEYTATVKTPTATATAATGVVEFWSAGAKKGEQAVADGVAIYSLTGLAEGSILSYTAKFVPAATNADYAASAETAAVTVAVPALPTQLTAGMAAKAGTQYRVEFPAGTFSASGATTRAAGATLTGKLGTTALTETAIVAADGSARYIFTVPADVAVGSAQSLVVTDGTTASTLAFTIAAAAVVPPAANPVTKPAANAAALFRTDWAAAATSSPAAVITVIGSLLALAGASVGGWAIWRRRRVAQA